MRGRCDANTCVFMRCGEHEQEITHSSRRSFISFPSFPASSFLFFSFLASSPMTFKRVRQGQCQKIMRYHEVLSSGQQPRHDCGGMRSLHPSLSSLGICSCVVWPLSRRIFLAEGA